MNFYFCVTAGASSPWKYRRLCGIPYIAIFFTTLACSLTLTYLAVTYGFHGISHSNPTVDEEKKSLEKREAFPPGSLIPSKELGKHGGALATFGLPKELMKRSVRIFDDDDDDDDEDDDFDEDEDDINGRRGGGRRTGDDDENEGAANQAAFNQNYG